MLACVFSATAGSKIEVEDTLVANILFETGALGNVEVTTATRPIDLESSPIHSWL